MTTPPHSGGVDRVDGNCWSLTFVLFVVALLRFLIYFRVLKPPLSVEPLHFTNLHPKGQIEKRVSEWDSRPESVTQRAPCTSTLTIFKLKNKQTNKNRSLWSLPSKSPSLLNPSLRCPFFLSFPKRMKTHNWSWLKSDLELYTYVLRVSFYISVPKPLNLL